jgi:hypothetical protein
VRPAFKGGPIVEGLKEERNAELAMLKSCFSIFRISILEEMWPELEKARGSALNTSRLRGIEGPRVAGEVGGKCASVCVLRLYRLSPILCVCERESVCVCCARVCLSSCLPLLCARMHRRITLARARALPGQVRSLLHQVRRAGGGRQAEQGQVRGQCDGLSPRGLHVYICMLCMHIYIYVPRYMHNPFM